MSREARPAVYLPEERWLEDHCDWPLECGVGVDDYSDRVVVAGRNLARDVDVSERWARSAAKRDRLLGVDERAMEGGGGEEEEMRINSDSSPAFI